MADDILETLLRIQRQLNRIEDKLSEAMLHLDTPPLGLHVVKLSNTVSGPSGEVLPGPLAWDGPEALHRFQELGQATMVPLHDLPPWTHMAFAQRAWWLVQMA